MAIATRKMTAEELWALPEDQRGELIRGEMTPVTPVGNPHWKVVGRLISMLGPYVEERGLGDVGPEGGFILSRDPDVVVAPDVAYVRAGRVADDEPGFMPLAPDLAVDVISPSNSARDLSARIRLYLDAGVRQVWIVDPYERTVTVYTPDRTARLYVDGETLDGGDVLPGFRLAIGDVFG